MKFQTLYLALMLPCTAVAAVRQEINTSEDFGYGVDFFECDQEFNKIPWEKRHVKNQGSVYRMCIQPNAKARQEGVGIKSVDKLIWHMTTVEAPGFVSTDAVTNGKADNQINILSEEIPSQLFVLESMLPVSFYINPGAVQGLGLATMTKGSGDVEFSDFIFKSDVTIDMSAIQMAMTKTYDDTTVGTEMASEL